MPPRITRIGLIFSHSLAYCRGVMHGIREFAELRPHWVLMPVAPEPLAIRALAKMKPAGVIAHIFTGATSRAVLELRKPFVNVSGMMRVPLTPRVGNDDMQCGRMAARHLMDRGLRHFGFVGTADHHYSTNREAGFRSVIENAGHHVEIYHDPPHQALDLVGRLWLQDPAVGRWLASLPHPIGVFASDDAWGFRLTEVCRQVHLRVPEDVSIIGVENDELLCNLARPTLSTVQLSSRRVGIGAARLLDRLLRGRAAPRSTLLIPPAAVVSRRSTDILAIDDADVASAVRFIRENAHRSLHIRDVLANVPVSRRSLERRFRSALGRSMLDEMRRMHVERACRLLTETAFPVPVVAEASGFSDGKQLWLVFRQLLGQTPTEFRRAAKDANGMSGPAVDQYQ